VGNRLGIGEERDKGEGGLAGWADEGEHLVDPSQEAGPFGWARKGGIGWSE
jgi:hypothetical protein